MVESYTIDVKMQVNIHRRNLEVESKRWKLLRLL